MACSCGVWVEGDRTGVAAGEYAGSSDATVVGCGELETVAPGHMPARRREWLIG
jgi:hypothetical protein